MLRSQLALFISLSVFSIPSFAHVPPLFDTQFLMPSTLIAKVKFKNYQLGMRKLNLLHLDVAGIDIKNKSADVIINEGELEKLKEMGFDVTVTMTKSLMRAPSPEYKTPEEIEEILTDYHNRFPEQTELKEVGKSLLGRSIWALKISEHADIHDPTKPVVLFNGMHHAREVMGPEVALDIIETLLTNYGKNEKITHWVESNEIWVMPMFNVDGNNLVWTKDSMWRKNARDNYGVDINRNYPYAWGTCNGSSGYKFAQDYRGESAASEPETNVMMNLVKNIRPVFDISYHSYSELVIYPLGCNGERVQNADVVESIGQQMGKALDYTAGTAWETLYSVDGGDIDWMYSEYQVIPYVIEVNSSADGFQPPFSKRAPTVELNRKAWQLLLDRLDGPGVRGVVKVKGTSLSNFTIKIQKKEASKFNDYMTYKGNADGSYHVVLNPGEYQVILSGPSIQTTAQLITIEGTRKEINFNL